MQQLQKFSELTSEQKKAIGLLSVGTFLEYFDLMLYVHMAVLLNQLFFPPADDPHISALFSAAAFCSTYFLKPFGAMFFGWIGDNIGRKQTVVITTFMMSIACIIMANLDTYKDSGVTVTWIVTFCRMAQGLSSIGELTGSQLYVTEITKPPVQYPSVAIIWLSSTIGSVVALAVASLTLSYGLNWRVAFWIGAGIALIGSYARSALRETPEFVDAKRRLKMILEGAQKDVNKVSNIIIEEVIDKKAALALFVMDCAMPVFFYLTYIHLGHFLKHKFGYSGSEVIYHNFKVGLLYLLGCIVQTYLSYRIHPLKILRVRTIILLIFLVLYPYLFSSMKTPLDLFIIQTCIIVFAPSNFPAVSIFFKCFPVFKRFTCTSMLHAVSHTLIYIITSFGFVYLIKFFGQLGVLVLVVPISIAFILGLRYFEKLERVDDYQEYQKNVVPAMIPAAV